jgi:hypothetical protein
MLNELAISNWQKMNSRSALANGENRKKQKYYLQLCTL